MDLAAFAEQDMADDGVSTTFPPKGPSLMDEEHVTWQSSQRREVLSRLIVSTKKQFQRDGSPAESQVGWPLSPFGTESSPQCDNGNVAGFSRHSARPLSRTRTSEENIEPRLDPAKSTTSDRNASIPFFDKENPGRFLALLKGVSARVDENAGLRNYDVPGPSGPTNGIAKLKRKRPQMTSVGRSLAAKRIRPSTSAGGEIGRISNEFEPAFSKLRGYQSLPDVTSDHRSSQETKELQTGPVINDPPVISPPFSQQSKDPPLPPCPAARPKPDVDDSRSYPKLHPLLQKAPPTPSSMTPPRGSCSGVAMIRGFSNSTPVSGVLHGSPESATSSRTSTPGAAGSGRTSSRLPALGMRRTRTIPSQTYGFQNQTKPALPTRQKSFKPPLLSNRSQHPN